MKHFVIYNSAGEILRCGGCPEEAFDLQCGPDEFIIEAEADPSMDAVDVPFKQIVRGGRKPPEIGYQEARMVSYPAVSEQLDMLWHAMNDGQMARVEPFYTRIKTVKQAYPKDGSVPGGSVVIYSME